MAKRQKTEETFQSVHLSHGSKKKNTFENLCEKSSILTIL